MSVASDAPRTVVVTGASRGIGRATAVRFGREGARVVVNYPPGEQEHAEKAATEIRNGGGTPLLVEADVADADAVARLEKTVHDAWGVADIVVSNAGICPFAEFFDIDVDMWDRVHHVNLRGCFLVSQAFTRRMVEVGRGGQVIAMSSISAWAGGSHQVHYCATKAGISSLMKSLAIVLGPHGITCNAILPGAILTDINRDDLSEPAKRQYVEGRIPLNRIGEPDDVADLVWLMCQPGARYVNGAEVVIDGGLFVNLQ